MIFKYRKLYRWIGPTKPSEWSIPEELSAIWEKGEPHMLLNSGKHESSLIFNGILGGVYPLIPWAYGGFKENFEEVIKSN